MLSEKENFLRMIRGEEAEYVPSVINLFQITGCTAGIDGPGIETPNIDAFGVPMLNPEGQSMIPDPNRTPILDDICDWREKIVFPDLKSIDWEGSAARDIPKRDPNKILALIVPTGPFERLHALMGFENALMATITRLCDYKIEQLPYLKKYYNPDMIQFHDDWGTQRDLMFSPDFWEYAIKDNIKRVIDAYHSEGIIFNMHTCGKVDKIIDQLVELGPDMIDSMMICNDLDRWMRDFGKKVVFMGGIDSQGVIDRDESTKKQLREEMKSRIYRYAPHGNYIPMVYTTGPNILPSLIFASWYGYGFKHKAMAVPLFLRMLGGVAKQGKPKQKSA